MERNSKVYQAYVRILHEELIPAMGCTEPIAIAYAAAKAREVLGRLPGQVWLGVSNNIIKNVKSVIVPNTGGMKGIEAAAAAGIVGGQAGRALEVISEVTEEQKAEMRRFLESTPIQVEAVDYGQIFDITVRLAAGEETAAVRIAQSSGWPPGRRPPPSASPSTTPTSSTSKRTARSCWTCRWRNPGPPAATRAAPPPGTAWPAGTF